MQEQYYTIKKNQPVKLESIAAAKQCVALFYKIESPDVDQFFNLAAAHFTLSQQHTLSNKHCRMHLNSSITLLQKIRPLNNSTKNKGAWLSLLANSYAKRAELSEMEDGLSQALNDYLRILDLFEANTINNIQFHSMNSKQNSAASSSAIDFTSNLDRLLIAQTALSIADLVVNQLISEETCDSLNIKKPIYYINLALETLSKLPKEEDEIIITLAFAHQMLALATASQDFNLALSRYRISLSHAFSATPKAACQILGDLYNSLGLLYEMDSQDLLIAPDLNKGSDHAMIYFSIALFFCPIPDLTENNILPEYPDSHELIDIILNSIHRTLDLYPYPLGLAVMEDFIDALIFVYYCIIDRCLPNEVLANRFTQADFLDFFAQHIYWLVSEYNRRINKQSSLLSYIEDSENNLGSSVSNNLEVFFNKPKTNNVFQFKRQGICT